MDKAGWRLREEREWHRYYASSAHPYIYESKFATGEASVSLAELQSRWGHWDEGEQVQFAQAFCSKPVLSSEDEQILDFLMREDGEMVSSSIANTVAKISDKTRAGRFLVDCVKSFPNNRANFLTALARLAAPETVPDLFSVFEECSRKIAKNAQDYDCVADLLYCAAGLFRTTAERKYVDVIISYLRHPSDQVRYQAENAMRWAGVSG